MSNDPTPYEHAFPANPQVDDRPPSVNTRIEGKNVRQLINTSGAHDLRVIAHALEDQRQAWRRRALKAEEGRLPEPRTPESPAPSEAVTVSRVGLPTDAVTRVEVVGDGGRLLVKRPVSDVSVELQDGGRTLKVFLREPVEPTTVGPFTPLVLDPDHPLSLRMERGTASSVSPSRHPLSQRNAEMNHNVKRIVEHRWCTVECECGETFDNADTAKAVQAWGDHYAEARRQPPSEDS